MSTVKASATLSKEGNSFGLIRLVLAALVIISHSWSIGGYGFEPLTLTSSGISLGLFAVSGFFCLSGMLIGVSAERSTAGAYMRRRAARILPGYWAALIVSGLVFGCLIAIVRDLDIRNALLSPANGSVRTYMINNFPLSASQFNLGRVLDGMPYPSGINGSLWSLPYEFACYLVILVVIKWAIGSSKPGNILSIIFGLSLVIAILANKQGPIFVGLPFPILGVLDSRLFFNLWLAFLAGSMTAYYRNVIPLRLSWTLASCLLVLISIPADVFWPWGILLLPYALLGISHYLPHRTRSIGQKVDISYGLYLYGFPVGQLIVALIDETSWNGPLLAIVTILGTIPLAVLSWQLVEKHFASH
jgi:peptidoglycan/LPS O-acetylase OafA/YrhL